MDDEKFQEIILPIKALARAVIQTDKAEQLGEHWELCYMLFKKICDAEVEGGGADES